MGFNFEDIIKYARKGKIGSCGNFRERISFCKIKVH